MPTPSVRAPTVGMMRFRLPVTIGARSTACQVRGSSSCWPARLPSCSSPVTPTPPTLAIGGAGSDDLVATCPVGGPAAVHVEPDLADAVAGQPVGLGQLPLKAGPDLLGPTLDQPSQSSAGNRRGAGRRPQLVGAQLLEQRHRAVAASDQV